MVNMPGLTAVCVLRKCYTKNHPVRFTTNTRKPVTLIPDQNRLNKMKPPPLIDRPGIEMNIKLHGAYQQFHAFLEELDKKVLTDTVARKITTEVEELNRMQDIDPSLKKSLRQRLNKIIKLLEKEQKIVPRNYYRNLWLALGMSVFGLPLGVVFGNVIGNLAMLSIGLPIGMGIGAIVGTGMDKKALAEGRQLDIEIKY